MQYTYAVSDTANNKVDNGGLTAEIHAAPNITIAVSYISTNLGLDQLVIVMKAALSQDEQDALTALVAAHQGSPVEPIHNANIVNLNAQGSGVRFRSQSFADAKEPLEIVCSSGKKLMMLTSKVSFDEALENMPHLVFELQKKLNLGAGEQYYIVDQNYYDTLADVCVDADREDKCGTQFRLEFDWPGQEEKGGRERKATILEGATEDKIRIYMTDDDIHVGEGTDPTNLFEYIAGVKVYHTYNLCASCPNWPAEGAPRVKAAHVCFHCKAYNEDDI
jgi:hypothetical protein